MVAAVFVRVRPVQHRECARTQQRARRRPHQLQRRGVRHVQRHLQQVHHHDGDDDLANLVLQVVDGTDAQPRGFLEVALVELGPGQEELEGPEAEDEAHHAQQEPVQRADRGGDELNRVEVHPRHHALKHNLLHPHREQKRAKHERRAHAEQHEPAGQEER